MKALLLTDGQAKLNDMVSWLEGMELQVITVFSVRRSLQVLHNDSTIDLIIADAGISDGNDTKLVQGVKRDPRTRSIPIIMVSESFDASEVQEYLASGIDDIIVLPTAKETFEGKVQKALQRGRETILVVDDEPLIRSMIEQFLKIERYRPVLAESAEQALEILEQQPIDAVITDVVLGEMSGLDLLVKVKEYNPAIPVIVITGFSGSYGPQDVIGMGADGFFVKPFHNVDLVFTLRKVMARTKSCREERRATAK